MVDFQLPRRHYSPGSGADRGKPVVESDVPRPGPVAVVGGGSIGVAFAVVFARSGRQVRLQEPDVGRRATIPAELATRLAALREHGLLAESPEAVAARVIILGDLGEAATGVSYLQECAPEMLDLKRSLFSALDRLTGPDTLLASASSTIVASAFAAGLPGRRRMLVAHPGNPPFLMPVIELVPAPFTDPACIHAAADLLRASGMEPVVLGKEVEGFVFNRLQGALLREAYCLVRDGVATVDDIDRIVRDGLGLR